MDGGASRGFTGFDVERDEKVIRSTKAGDAIDVVLMARRP